jgi:hypothetical protein
MEMNIELWIVHHSESTFRISSLRHIYVAGVLVGMRYGSEPLTITMHFRTMLHEITTPELCITSNPRLRSRDNLKNSENRRRGERLLRKASLSDVKGDTCLTPIACIE